MGGGGVRRPAVRQTDRPALITHSHTAMLIQAHEGLAVSVLLVRQLSHAG